MYRESYQRGLLTIFFSCGSKPLNIWDTYTKNGYITKFLDEDIKSTVLEIGGTNVSTTYMICPKGKMVLGITMPFLIMIVKNLKKYFSFEVTILDDTGTRRRFRVSNFQSTTQILPLCTVMPINLSEGWNQIQFNMSDFCKRAYKKQFVEVQKFKLNANIRVRRIYFADRILPEDQLPAEYKLFIPLKQKPGTAKPKAGEEIVAPEPEKIEEKRDSKLASVSKVTKAASVVKTVSQMQAEGAEVEVTIKPSTAATAGTAEGGPDQGDVVAAVPDATAEGGPVDVAAEVAVGTSEGGPDQSDVAAEVPVATAEEPGVVEESGPDQSAPPAEASTTEAPVVTEEIPLTEEAATDTTELVKEKSVEAAVQTEGVVVIVDAPVEDVATEDAKQLEPTEDKE